MMSRLVLNLYDSPLLIPLGSYASDLDSSRHPMVTTVIIPNPLATLDPADYKGG